MGSKLSIDENVHVVVVGGGFGGIAAAIQLKSLGVPYTLIDMKDAFHHNVGALRASVQSGFAKTTFISYSATFNGNFKQGKVMDIDTQKQCVILEDREEVCFSHLILATGSDGPFPGKFNKSVTKESAIQMYENLVQEVQKAERIVVVGGGSAGVEMAAEIKSDYPQKERHDVIVKRIGGGPRQRRQADMEEVTLIHSKVALADVELLPSVRQTVKEILLRKGVKLLLSQRASNLTQLKLNEVQQEMSVETDKGTTVTADLVICCTGIKVNSSAYSNALKLKLADNGALRVNEHLQVEGSENIYAIGDCADVKEPKMAYHAELHAKVAVKNIVNSLTQKPLAAYEPGGLSIRVSMGLNDGVGQINGCYVGQTWLRAKTCLLGKAGR
ncbi:apoptosis-inducing factor 2 isoform X2 [Latimeria chalumnae]|uniref:apoptosis-inducing factor 2 isoform X2 n=1 Tax=Latimeria chalumnae TaxID=7897 RepID=UPI0003C1045C|nr:PREDICTED: apoptosis-inducing factor 2 isoform X2 [Latimeria chalumnae]|eukprot:XP_005996179.1 PREDICTED: apoptosis-inducing factor 2 isoform X2 [Latimeria chalumnae]